MLHRLHLLTAAWALAACGLAGCVGEPPPVAPASLPSSNGANDANEDTRLLHVPLVASEGGAVTDLAGAAGGQVTVVAMWATWCDACKREMPSLLRLEAKARARGDFRVVAVAVGEDVGDVRAFATTYTAVRTQLVDEHYALSGPGRDKVPTTLVIDRRGRVVHVGDALDRKALGALRAALDAK